MNPNSKLSQNQTQRQRLSSTIVEHERFRSAVAELEDIMLAQLNENVSQGVIPPKNHRAQK